MKYIIDTDEFEPLFKVDSIGIFGIGKSINDDTKNHSWSRIESIEEFEELNSDYINEHFGDLQDEAYKRGFEDGKGAIHAGYEGCQNEGAKIFELPCSTCRNAYPNHWEAKKKDDEIKVGDEVEWDGTIFIVTRIYQPYNQKEQCDGIDDDGCVYNAVLTEVLTKTGRHFDIGKILEEMKE